MFAIPVCARHRRGNRIPRKRTEQSGRQLHEKWTTPVGRRSGGQRAHHAPISTKPEIAPTTGTVAAAIAQEQRVYSRGIIQTLGCDC